MFSASQPPPPIRHHHTTQIPQSRALDLISAYLDAAKTTTDIIPTTPNASSPPPSSHPLSLSTPRNSIPTAAVVAPRGAALHPNAVLTEAGPVVPAGGVAGLVLRNLERVRAGLKGESWVAEPAEEGLWLDESRKEQGFLGEGKMEMGGASRGEGWEDGWQDKEEFEREQEQEVFVRDEDVTAKDVPSVTAMPARIDEGSRPVNRNGEDATIDRHARKKAKKARRKEEQKSRARARENKVSQGR